MVKWCCKNGQIIRKINQCYATRAINSGKEQITVLPTSDGRGFAGSVVLLANTAMRGD